MQAAAATTSDLEFSLNFLWMDKNIAVAVDQVFSKVILLTFRLWAATLCPQFLSATHSHPI